VLIALRDKLMRRDLFEEFCREYVKELNRLRMEHRAKVSHGRQELAVVEREIGKLIRASKMEYRRHPSRRSFSHLRRGRPSCTRSSRRRRCLNYCILG
jgi:hypothetical protein